MHKCEHCGTEFEGKFCPNCGTPAPLEACPNCGAKLSPTDKFCPECGKPLRAPAAPQSAPVPAAPTPSAASAAKPAPSPALMKFLSLLPYVTPVLFGIFSALLFLMLLGPVSTAMGMGTGSVYDYLSAPASMGAMMGSSTVTNVCTALVILAALGVGYSACVLAFRFYIPLRVKKIGSLRVCTLLEWGTLPFYFADFLLGCILCGTVSDGLTSPGAGTVCVLVFALFFGLCTAGILLLQKFSSKLFPAETAMLVKQKAARRAALRPPAAPEEVKKPQKPDYTSPITVTDELNKSLEKYEKAKKLFIVLAALGAAIAALTWLFGAVIPYWTSGSDTGDESFHLLFGDTLPLMHADAGFEIHIAMLIMWPICFGLYLILGGSIGAAYYKKKKLSALRQPERILSDKRMMISAIVLPIALFALNLILAGIIYAAYGWEDYYIFNPDTMQTEYLGAVGTSLGKYMGGAIIMNVIITVCYLIAEIAFYFGIRGKKSDLLALAHPQETAAYYAQQKAYTQYRYAVKKYRKQLAYYEEGIAWKKARS